MHLRFSRHVDLLSCLIVPLFVATLVACGGSSTSDSGGGTNVGGGGNGGGGGSGGGGGNPPTASISPAESLGSKQPVSIEFSEGMEPDSLTLEGTLNNQQVQIEWSVDNEVVTLAPTYYWPPGRRTLSISAENADGEAANADAEFAVESAFVNSHEAALVIGQADFTGNESRQGGTHASANTLDEPLGSAAYSEAHDVLFIPDTWDSRVLGFHGMPTVNNANADFVLGQPDFHSSRGELGQANMNSPQYITTDHGRLIITDTENYRVAIYDDVPADGSALPSVVVGQPDFDTRIALNNSQCDDRTLNHSHSHFLTESGKFLVAASWQNRVMIWNQLPTENYQPADMVLGQPDLHTCRDVPGGGTFRHPTDIWTDEEKLVIVDSEKHRLLIWNTFPTENFQEPDVIIGQSELRNEAPNDDNQDGEPDENASARTLDYPRSLWIEQGQMFVADMNNHRILIWNEIPTESFTPADIVIGQEDFAANGGNSPDGISEDPPSAGTFNSPTGVSVFQDKMFVTERFNHRVLIFEAK